MRLTGLRLSGFKSFADPTELPVAPGLTGVVGPNGCGKSNLLEALRWAMGETRPTQMRGQGMEDVIFAGTTRRKPKATAEVALTLDRGGEEVEVVRRISRDGGSSYRMGGREARARDVQTMFADAASGAQSPALVRQGQIAELIAARPFARRRVIEEAAGVAGLQVRRAEAAQRLGAAEANLARAGEGVQALADRLRSLERQARNARSFREVTAALRAVEGRLLWRAWAAAEEAAQGAAGGARTAGAEARRAEGEAARASARRAEAEGGLPALRAAAARAVEARATLAAAAEALAAQGRAAGGRLRAAREAEEALARDQAREATLGEDAAAQLAALTGEAARLAGEGEGEGAAMAAALAASEAAARALRESEADLVRATEAAARLSAEAAAAVRRVQEARGLRDRAGSEAARGAASLAEAEAARDRALRQGEAAQAARAEALRALAGTEEAAAAAEALLPPLREAEAAARAEVGEAQAQAGALAAELRALARLVEADARRGALDLGVPEGWEAAVVAALGPDLRARVAEGEGSGWAALPPFADPPPPPPGAEPLAPRVTAPPALARRLALTYLAADAAALHGTLRPGQAVVTPGGDLLRWDGMRVLARDAAEAAAEAEALRRAARLPRLKGEAEAAEARAGAARDAAREAGAAVADAQRRADAARAARGAAERQASEAERAGGRAEADRALAEARAEAARAARDRQAEAVRAASDALSAAESAQAALPDPREARAEAERAGQAAGAARQALLAARAAEDDLRRAGERRVRRLAEVAREEASWRARAAAGAERGADLAGRRARAAREVSEAEARVPELAARAAEAGQRLAEAEAARGGAEAALAAAEEAARATAEAERAAERGASEAREAFARAEERRLAAEETLALAAARIREARGLTPAQLLHDLGDPAAIPPEPALQAEAATLRKRRDAIGPVNLRAEEDARALRDEQGVLLSEIADLEGAIAALRQALQALNREGRERMVVAFARVNDHFARLFRHLFGGGEARLAFVEGDDPLEAGVEIYAQPPGKALQTLTLLSGGEQTLTALALIFAVFLTAPAPVCVLDEVDAPLDDANVGRFCDLLDAMARDTETRFLVITHHAVTMARMDRLFGVTMAEPGVSQLVSVDLGAAEAMVA